MKVFDLTQGKYIFDTNIAIFLVISGLMCKIIVLLNLYASFFYLFRMSFNKIVNQAYRSNFNNKI